MSDEAAREIDRLDVAIAKADPAFPDAIWDARAVLFEANHRPRPDAELIATLRAARQALPRA